MDRLEKYTHALDTALSWIVIITLSIIPVFFLPITTNFYGTNKALLLLICSVLIILGWCLRSMITRKISLPTDPIILGPLALTLSSFVSVIFRSSNFTEGLAAPTGPVVFLTLTVVTAFSTVFMKPAIKKYAIWFLAASAGALGLISIYQFFGIGKLMFPGVAYMQDSVWTPTGATLATLIYMITLVPVMVEILTDAIKKRNEASITISSIIAILLAGGILTGIAALIPIIGSQIFPLNESWRIMMEAFKTPLAALLGTGPENYIVAFTQGKSQALNALPIWNIRMNIGSTTFFHIGTTMGIIGMLALALFLRPLFTSPRNSRGLWLTMLFAAVGLLISPPNIVMFTLVVALYISLRNREAYDIHVPHHIAWIPYGITALTCVLLSVSGYFIFRYFKGEVIFFRSLKAAEVNDGSKTYNLQIEALKANPYNTQFHLTYSQTNLALANSLTTNATQASDSAQNANPTLSEQDRQLISQLLQQAIREAKAGTTLSPLNAVAWETLANIYRNIMGVVTGADSWTIASFQRAISLDPVNPLLRFNLGGVYLALGDYENASRLFQEAIILKGDVSNFYYNLAYSFRQQKKYLPEAQALQAALRLIPETAPEDRQKAQEELAAAKKQLTPDQLAALEGTTNTATQPDRNQQPLTSPGTVQPQLTPKIELPQEASPAVTPVEENPATESSEMIP